MCLWGKIKKEGRKAEKEGDIREIGKKVLERKRKCNILNIYLINIWIYSSTSWDNPGIARLLVNPGILGTRGEGIWLFILG